MYMQQTSKPHEYTVTKRSAQESMKKVYELWYDIRAHNNMYNARISEILSLIKLAGIKQVVSYSLNSKFL